MPKPEDEIEARVPHEPTDNPSMAKAIWREMREQGRRLDSQDAKLDRALAVLEGRHDEQGQHHPGMSQELAALRDRVARLEKVAATTAGVAVAVLTAWLAAWVVGSTGPKAQAATPPPPPWHPPASHGPR